MHKSTVGIIGLGVMGRNLAANVLDKGYSVSVFNRSSDSEKHLVPDFLDAHLNEKVQGFNDIASFVHSLETPRKVLLMVKAGEAVDQVLHAMLPFLNNGDVLIDGGNSHFRDTQRRTSYLQDKGFHFIGCGISGGEDGARYGPSLMPGGSSKAYQAIEAVLTSIAATDQQGLPCCAYIGKDGAGHFVKMIHNGIEYAEMQLLAECYAMLSSTLSNEEISMIFTEWNNGPLASFLLEITIAILKKKEKGQYLLDLILDKASSKGTGSWSSQIALELGFPATMITDAVFARYISSLKTIRSQLHQSKGKIDINSATLKEAYSFARLINHMQGFLLMEEASRQYQWNLSLPSIAGIWTNGCIIRSNLMERCVDYLKNGGSILLHPAIQEQLKSSQSAIQKVLSKSIHAYYATPVLSSSYQYWLAITSAHLPANLIQAQRDYFGAHTYQRIDKGETFFHTEWTND